MTIVDVHTHLAPLLDAADDHTVDGEKVGPPALFSRDSLLAYLDTAGIDVALVSVPPPFYRQGNNDPAGWATLINDGLLARLAHSRQGSQDRLRPLAYLPLEDPDAAITELIRLTAHSAGAFAGFVASAGGSSVSLAAPELAPLWAALDEQGALLFLHPGHSHDHRLDEFYLGNLLGNPVETGVAVAQLVFGAIPSRYPGIRFLLAHGGGVVPAVVGRWERGLDSARPGVNPTMERPRASVARFFADSLTYDAGRSDAGHSGGAFVLAEATFGANRMVLGSDWPFPMGSTDPLADLPTTAAERVSATNATELLGS